MITIILIKNAVVTYDTKEIVYALSDVSLLVEQGEWLSVLGPSGSGKTTLLNIISSKLSLTSGTIEVNNKNLSNMPEVEKQQFRRETIGFVYQHYRLFNQFTVLENVMIPQWPYQKKTAIRKHAEQLLKQVNLSHRLQHLPEQLSGGEKQRVAIARSLLNHPQILLCDEPTGNLDAENREIVLDILEGLHKNGMTIIVVTHDTKVAKRTSRHLFLRDGVLEDRVIT